MGLTFFTTAASFSCEDIGINRVYLPNKITNTVTVLSTVSTAVHGQLLMVADRVVLLIAECRVLNQM